MNRFKETTKASWTKKYETDTPMLATLPGTQELEASTNRAKKERRQRLVRETQLCWNGQVISNVTIGGEVSKRRMSGENSRGVVHGLRVGKSTEDWDFQQKGDVMRKNKVLRASLEQLQKTGAIWDGDVDQYGIQMTTERPEMSIFEQRYVKRGGDASTEVDVGRARARDVTTNDRGSDLIVTRSRDFQKDSSVKAI